MKVCPHCQGEFDDSLDFCPNDDHKLRRKRLDQGDPMLGRTLDERWVIQEKLGEGGMGAVYLAHQRSMSRSVAIKTLRKELVDSEEFVDRFLREVNVATSLNHPHIVTVYDYGQDDDGTLFLVMELLEGVPLTKWLQQGRVTPDEALRIAIQITSALEAAHATNIVHRDLKPDNVFMLTMPGGGIFAKVLDFGIAKVMDNESKMTKTGMIFGTPEYMSPEQCKGVGVDHRSDLYALGCILYEMLGGRTPFKADTPMALLMAHVGEPAPKPSSFGTSIDPRIEDFVMSLLAKDPDDRPPTANAVRLALERLLAGEPSGIAAVAEDDANIAFAPTGAFEAAPSAPLPAVSKPAGRVAALVVVGLLVCAGGALAAWKVFGTDATPDAPAIVVQPQQADVAQHVQKEEPAVVAVDERDAGADATETVAVAEPPPASTTTKKAEKRASKPSAAKSEPAAKVEPVVNAEPANTPEPPAAEKQPAKPVVTPSKFPAPKTSDKADPIVSRKDRLKKQADEALKGIRKDAKKAEADAKEQLDKELEKVLPSF
ncbi:MAG: protein kinase [bacterium]